MSHTTVRTVPLLELKAVSDTPGLIRGRASVYGVIDSYNDEVMPGAFTKTLHDNRGAIVVLSQHDPAQSIGKALLSDHADGLHCEIRLALDIPKAAEEYARVKAGLVDGISIGYSTVREDYKNGVRRLQEIRLWEISLVTFPANDAARVTAVKDARQDTRGLLTAARELRSTVQTVVTVSQLTRAAATLRNVTGDLKRLMRNHR